MPVVQVLLVSAERAVLAGLPGTKFAGVAVAVRFCVVCIGAFAAKVHVEVLPRARVC